MCPIFTRFITKSTTERDLCAAASTMDGLSPADVKTVFTVPMIEVIVAQTFRPDARDRKLFGDSGWRAAVFSKRTEEESGVR